MSACRSKSDSAGESSFVFTAFLSYDFVAVLLQLVTLAVARSWMLALLLLYFLTIRSRYRYSYRACGNATTTKSVVLEYAPYHFQRVRIWKRCNSCGAPKSQRMMFNNNQFSPKDYHQMSLQDIERRERMRIEL